MMIPTVVVAKGFTGKALEQLGRFGAGGTGKIWFGRQREVKLQINQFYY